MLQRRVELGLGNQFTYCLQWIADGWYMTDKMADFFSSFVSAFYSHFLWLTRGRPQRVETLMQQRGIAPSSFSIRSVAAADVPSYLSAADAGISFIKPCFSKLASSPTKNGE